MSHIKSKKLSATTKSTVEAAKPPHATQQRVTKIGIVISLLKRPGGATIESLADATGGLHHTICSVLSRTLPKSHGCRIASIKSKGEMRIYRIKGRR